MSITNLIVKEITNLILSHTSEILQSNNYTNKSALSNLINLRKNLEDYTTSTSNSLINDLGFLIKNFYYIYANLAFHLNYCPNDIVFTVPNPLKFLRLNSNIFTLRYENFFVAIVGSVFFYKFHKKIFYFILLLIVSVNFLG